YGYRDGAVIVKFRTGPFNVTAYLFEDRFGDQAEEADILGERLDFKRRIENLNGALQEWSPEEYYDFVQEYSPAARKPKPVKEERPPNPWLALNNEQCVNFLEQPDLDDLVRAKFL